MTEGRDSYGHRAGDRDKPDDNYDTRCEFVVYRGNSSLPGLGARLSELRELRHWVSVLAAHLGF